VPILGNYIIRTVLGYTALVMLVLLALGALFLFIGQQDDIGTGSYTATQALLFVALNLPTYLFQLLPVGALIGALLGLGNLARGSELVVMRASGVTTARFCVWLAAAGVILAFLMVCLGEFVASPATAAPGCATATRSSASRSSRPARATAGYRCTGSIRGGACLPWDAPSLRAWMTRRAGSSRATVRRASPTPAR